MMREKPTFLRFVESCDRVANARLISVLAYDLISVLFSVSTVQNNST
jgi:hypothetical protein